MNRAFIMKLHAHNVDVLLKGMLKFCITNVKIRGVMIYCF